jgi:DNA-binding transcriptional regulator YdaS (Cro superfamily)
VVDGLDRDRLIRAAVEWGFSQVEVARRVGVTQARVNQIVHEEVPVPPAGFSGASPLEIAQRFVVGGISRERAVDELGRWSYISRDRPDGIDDAWEPGPGTWADVEAAHRAGLISDDMYDEALDRYAGRSNDG